MTDEIVCSRCGRRDYLSGNAGYHDSGELPSTDAMRRTVPGHFEAKQVSESVASASDDKRHWKWARSAR